jgi:hypothetical protein
MPATVYRNSGPIVRDTTELRYFHFRDNIALQLDERDGDYLGHVYLSNDDAIKFALQILKDQGREDLLAPVPEKKLGERIGEYVQNGRNVMKITGPHYGISIGRDYATAVDADGKERRIFNDPDKTYWTPVKVEVTPATSETWTVVDDKG